MYILAAARPYFGMGYIENQTSFNPSRFNFFSQDFFAVSCEHIDAFFKKASMDLM